MQHQIFDKKTINTLIWQPESACELNCPGCYSVGLFNSEDNGASKRASWSNQNRAVYRTMLKTIAGQKGFELNINQFILSLNHYTKEVNFSNPADLIYRNMYEVLRLAEENPLIHSSEVTMPIRTFALYSHYFKNLKNTTLNVSIDSYKGVQELDLSEGDLLHIDQANESFKQTIGYITCYKNTNYYELIELAAEQLDLVYCIIPKPFPGSISNTSMVESTNLTLKQIENIQSRFNNVFLDGCVSHAKGLSKCSTGINTFTVSPKGVTNCSYEVKPAHHFPLMPILKGDEDNYFEHSLEQEKTIYQSLMKYISDSRNALQSPLSDDIQTCPMKELLEKDEDQDFSLDISF